MIENEIILDSIGEHSPRLVTMRCRYPKFIHGEHLRHRSFSFSVSSSRAIPVSKNLEEVRSDELRASPVWWGKEQKGMQSGEELDDIELKHWVPRKQHNDDFVNIEVTDREKAKRQWQDASMYASAIAERMHKIGVHKSIVNRILEPFLHVNVLVTGTEPGWMNFFGLRLDRAAQPEIRTLAELQWKHWNESKPQELEPGQWHLPFVDVGEFGPYIGKAERNQFIKISIARCARLSYTSFETNRRSTIEEDLKLYDRLVGNSPIHASPAEHQATPDVWENKNFTPAELDEIALWYKESTGNWRHREQHGNLLGWRQYRKTLPGESLAPLPIEYR